jgi:hypothetical protein
MVNLKFRLVFLGGFTAQKHQHPQSPLPGKGGNRGDGNHCILLESDLSQTLMNSIHWIE